MDETMEHHPFMEQALLDDALLGEESSLDGTARAFSPMLVPEDQSNSEQSETRESQKSSPKNSKSMGCGKPGFITCSICNATKYYSHVQRRFGQFSCEPCSKFMKRFLRDPKVYTCVHSGECKIGRPSGEQEPRGVSVSRCKACWLRICLHKFVLDSKSKEVIEKYYAPRFAPNLKAAKAAAGTPSSTGSIPGPLLSRPGSCTELVQAPAADAPPLPGASIRKRRSAPAELSNGTTSTASSTVTASSSATMSVSQSGTSPAKLPGGERCTVRRVAARRKDFARYDFNGLATPKRTNKRTKEMYGNQPGQVRRLRRAVLPNLDRDSDSDETYRADMQEEFAHRRIGAYLEPRRTVSEAEEADNHYEREQCIKTDPAEDMDCKVVNCQLVDENNGPSVEECGKCSHCLQNGRSSNVLVLKESCKFMSLARPKSSMDNSRSNSTSGWEEALPSSLHTVEYYGGARAALSETIVRRAKRESVIEGDPLLWTRHPDNKNDPNFDKNNKKVKKRKVPVGSVKKSGIFKKNVNFYTDYAFLNEILNANSPFL